MDKINVSELLKILVWILPLANIFIEYQGHFLGLIWEDFKVGYFWTDFWGFQQTSIQLSEILDMMHECRCNYLWDPRHSFDLALHPIYSDIFQNPQRSPQKILFRRRSLLFPWDPILGPFRRSAEGESITVGIYINSIALPMKRE